MRTIIFDDCIINIDNLRQVKKCGTNSKAKFLHFVYSDGPRVEVICTDNQDMNIKFNKIIAFIVESLQKGGK